VPPNSRQPPNLIDELELPPYEDDVEEELISEEQENELLALSQDELLPEMSGGDNDSEALIGNPFLSAGAMQQSAQESYFEALAEVRK
jgi:hypothetical protein